MRTVVRIVAWLCTALLWALGGLIALSSLAAGYSAHPLLTNIAAIAIALMWTAVGLLVIVRALRQRRTKPQVRRARRAFGGADA